MVSKTTLNDWSKLSYRDPEKDLIRLRQLELSLPESGISKDLREFRVHELKQTLEWRQAALFSYGMSLVQGSKIYYSMTEKSDYDLVTMRQLNDCVNYCPVQLKELVPKFRNPNQDMRSLLDGLKKYTDSSDLVVAVHMNREFFFNPKNYAFSGYNFAGIWVFGGASDNQIDFNIFGDLQTGDMGMNFRYPGYDTFEYC